jgi:hypothetical protein
MWDTNFVSELIGANDFDDALVISTIGPSLFLLKTYAL